MTEQNSHHQANAIYYQVLLLLGDILLLYLALWGALALRYSSTTDWTLFLRHAQPFTAVYALWLVLFYTNNFYNLTRVRDQFNIYFDLTRTLLVGTVIGVLVFYLLPAYDLTPKRLLVLDAGIFGVALALWRTWFVAIFRRVLPINRVAIIGISPGSLELGREILARPDSGYQLAILVGDGEQTLTAPSLPVGVRLFNNPEEFIASIQTLNINTIIIADHLANTNVLGDLFRLLPLQFKFSTTTSFYEELTSRVPVTQLTHGWFLSNLDETTKHTYELTKRFLDLIVSGFFLVVFAPILVLIGVLIKSDSPGPVFYRQTRLGQRGKVFWVWKLRTMVQNAESAGPQWSQSGDPRITRIGRFLRRTRLDEIPQLINVVRGEMSLVGPRPERPEFVEKLVIEIPFYQTRHLVAPGMTGWAQVKFAYGASVKDALAKLQYDIYYIKHRSFSLDISIWIRTILIMLGLRGR